MLTDWRLWKRYPVLILVRFMQNTIRTTALLFFIMILALVTTVKKVDDLPVGFIAISLGLNWLLMFYFGAKLRRFKICLYPVMFVLNPFFNWYYMIYGIFTAGQRTWGGPRADAATADNNTSAREAIERAEEQGDELNVVPETFKSAYEARKGRFKTDQEKSAVLGRTKSQVLPPRDAEGKFSARRKTASGFYAHPDEADGPRAAMPSSHDSLDSLPPPVSPVPGRLPGSSYLVYIPTGMERLMGDEDRRKYFLAHQAQQGRRQARSEATQQENSRRQAPRLELNQPFDTRGISGQSDITRNHRYAQVVCGDSRTAAANRTQASGLGGPGRRECDEGGL
jgi:chitin synthase